MSTPVETSELRRALQEVRDAAGELDVLESPGDLAPGVVEHLAVLAGDGGSQLVPAGVEQLAQAEQQAGPPGSATTTPHSATRSTADCHGGVDLRRRRQRDLSRLRPGAGSKTGAVRPDRPATARPSTQCPIGVIVRTLPASEPVELAGVLAEDLAREPRARASAIFASTVCERVRVEARRVGEVRLEEDAVLADRLDQVGQLVAVVLEPERGVQVASGSTPTASSPARRAPAARSPTSRSRAPRG